MDNLIGSGVVVHIPSFFSELQALQNKGLSTAGRNFISSRAHIALNLHQLVDKWEEIALGNKSVGTTRGQRMPPRLRGADYELGRSD